MVLLLVYSLTDIKGRDMSVYQMLMEDTLRLAHVLGAEYAEMRLEPESVSESVAVEDERPVQVTSASESSMGHLTS